MEFRLLGPVDVRNGADPLPLGGPKPRALLAALLLNDGHVVPASWLVDVIWGEGSPPTARALVQTYVAGLRRTLYTPERPDVIQTRAPGYVLVTDPDNIDRNRFERLAAQGRRAAAHGQLDEAGQLLRAALALWQGPALSGVASELLMGEAALLDELHLSVVEERVNVDLALGRHEELVAELTGLVRRHPTRESLRCHLMLALYRCDRQADALAVYRGGRQVLVEELGIEPGHALRALHEAILRDDESLLHSEVPAAVSIFTAEATAAVGRDREHGEAGHPVATASHAVPAPAQLPAVPDDFVGRDAQIGELIRQLTPSPANESVPIAVISGQGGVGKSTLAARVGHALAAQYPDGQLFVQLHGLTTTPVTPDAVVARFLAALGDPVAELPASLEERCDRFRTVVANRRILVVLDDATDEHQVRPLLPGAGGCAVLVTSRSRLPGLAGAHLVELGVLAVDEARELLVHLAGAQRIAAEEQAATRLTELCGQLPLAVRVVGTRLANRRHWSVGQLTDRLEDEQRRLDELRVGDQEVRASISLSYQALDDRAQTALRRLGVLGLPNFPVWIIGALLDTTESEAEQVVERLVDGQFIDFARTDEIGQARYQIHDLLRLYAAERAAVQDDPAVCSEAVQRVMNTWLHLVDRIEAAHPSGGGVLSRPRQGATAQRAPAVADMALARPHAWFAAEEHSLIASVERAATMDLDDAAADLASALCVAVFATGNLFDAWNRTHVAALATVRRTGNRRAEARLLAELGQLRYEQDRFAEARTYYVQALATFREFGDVQGEAATLAAIGAACREQGYLPEALHFLTQARTLMCDLDDHAAAASVDRIAGSVHLELGDYPAARDHLDRALSAFRRLASRRGEAMTVRTIGLVYRAEGDYQRAYDLFEQARAIFGEIGDELLEAYSVRAMAKAQIRLGRAGDAWQPLQQALRTCRALHDRFGEALTLRTLGDLHLAEGRLGSAREDLQAALRLWHALDLPLARARTLRDLARLSLAAGDQATAHAQYAEAAEIAGVYGAREHAEILAELVARTGRDHSVSPAKL